MLLNDIQDRLNPRPWTRGYQVVPMRGVPPLIDLMIAHHEAAHCVFNYINGQRIHDVSISPGRGAGEFRSVPNPRTLADEGTPEGGAELIGMMMAACDTETRKHWLRDVVGYAVGRAAQRKFGAKDEYYDSFCWQDYQIINRVLDAITRDPERKAKYLRQVEDDAEEFVRANWRSICRLAEQIFERGTLNKREIEAVLAPPILLNETAAQKAYNLIAAGMVNVGGFAWDAADDAGEEYGLGVDAPTDDTEPRYHYPFGKDGEVYIQALQDATACGPPTVAAYAKTLLDHIQKQKEQNLENTTGGRTWGRALPRRPGDEPGFYRRVDGYFK